MRYKRNARLIIRTPNPKRNDQGILSSAPLEMDVQMPHPEISQLESLKLANIPEINMMFNLNCKSFRNFPTGWLWKMTFHWWSFKAQSDSQLYWFIIWYCEVAKECVFFFNFGEIPRFESWMQFFLLRLWPLKQMVEARSIHSFIVSNFFLDLVSEDAKFSVPCTNLLVVHICLCLTLLQLLSWAASEILLNVHQQLPKL